MPRQRPTIRSLRQPRARDYDRLKDLPRLLPITADDLRDRSRAGRDRLLAKLRRALRAERRRGIMGHWSYDLARHRALAMAYRAEAALHSPRWGARLR